MNENTCARILLIGLSPTGNADNALGGVFVSLVNSLGYEFLDCKYRTQLHPEDAELISEYDVAIFVTACCENMSSGFEIRRCFAAAHGFYSNNMQAPAAILHLTNKLYKKSPKAYLILISGEEGHEETSLSNEAENNLEAAMEYFNEQLLPSVLAVMT